MTNKAVVFKERLNLDDRVFIIANTLVEKVSIEGWKRIKAMLGDITRHPAYQVCGGDKGYSFGWVHEFMIGRVNSKEAKILELCVLGNVFKKTWYFEVALDFVEAIIELENHRCDESETFFHNVGPSKILFHNYYGSTMANNFY